MTLELCVASSWCWHQPSGYETPAWESTHYKETHLCSDRLSKPHQFTTRITVLYLNPFWLSIQRGETSLADQVSSCPPTCHTPLSPQRSGVELHPLRHTALCLLFKLFIKERGRQDETATHSGFVMLLVSPCIFPSAKCSLRARFVTR